MTFEVDPNRNGVERLDASDPAVIESFEQGFYQGFENAHHNRLIRTLWIWDSSAKRLRTRIPYEDQMLWGRFTDGRFDAGIAVNTALNELQSAAFGFAAPPELALHAAEGRLCEILALFVVEDNSLSGILSIWNQVFEELRRTGFAHALCTTATKILPLYRRLGAIVMDESEIDGQRRHFIHFDLERTDRWVKRETISQSAPELSNPQYLTTPIPPSLQALDLVADEFALQVARLLVPMNIARGEGDEGFDLDQRRRAAAQTRRQIQKYLARVAPKCNNEEENKAFSSRERQLASLESLTESVHQFAVAASQCGSPFTDTLIESLDFLILTALSVFDQEDGARQLLLELTEKDRESMVERLSKGEGGTDDLGVLGARRERDRHFSHAVKMLHRMFELG